MLILKIILLIIAGVLVLRALIGFVPAPGPAAVLILCIGVAFGIAGVFL